MKKLCILLTLLCLVLTGCADGLAEKQNPDAEYTEWIGYFEDVQNWYGAVTGTVYQNADQEIQVSASSENGELAVEAVFLRPADFPYRELEELGIAEYSIIDGEGNTVCVVKNSAEYGAIIGGKVLLPMSMTDIPGGDYRLQIQAFEGTKTGEQPLKIFGTWEMEICI